MLGRDPGIHEGVLWRACCRIWRDPRHARERGNADCLLDVLIAGQALARSLVLVTGNVREFARVEGLKVEEW